MRVLIVEGEPYPAEAVRDGLSREAIAADGELVLRLHAPARRRAYARPPVSEIAVLRLDPYRRIDAGMDPIPPRRHP